MKREAHVLTKEVAAANYRRKYRSSSSAVLDTYSDDVTGHLQKPKRLRVLAVCPVGRNVGRRVQNIARYQDEGSCCRSIVHVHVPSMGKRVNCFLNLFTAAVELYSRSKHLSLCSASLM